jgi:hypothetical protein
VSDRGSVFLEALVGSVIVAFAVLAMVQSVVTGARGDRKVEAHRLATLLAQSELASVGSAVPLAPGASGGSDGRFSWTIAVEQAGSGAHARVYRVSVSVREGSREILSLRSMKAGP